MSASAKRREVRRAEARWSGGGWLGAAHRGGSRRGAGLIEAVTGLLDLAFSVEFNDALHNGVK